MKNEYQKNKNDVIFNLKTGKLKLQICSDNIFRVVYAKENFPDIKSLIVLNNIKETGWDIKEENDSCVISTEKIKAVISSSGSIKFYDNDNNLILSENENKSAEFTPAEVLGENTYNIRQNFIISSDEGLYGLGQIPDGHINHRNKKDVTLVQSNKTVAIPFLVSGKSYGILWDNCSKTIFDNHSNNEMSFWSETGEAIDYYFILGKNIDEVISGYRFLTGKAPMFGKWAYGYWQSKCRYETKDELLSVAKEYRERKIPIDNIVQDWRYWGGNEFWSSMEWDEKIYPDPKNMIDMLHNEYNMHLMISIWPMLGRGSDIFKEMDSKGFLYDNDDHWAGGKVYDAFDPEARKIYWKYMNKGLFSMGADAFWMDATEPEFAGSETQEVTEKGIKKCKTCGLGNIARYLNAYSLMTTAGAYEGQRSVSSDKRVFILSRSGFAGQQRYAAATWSGDIGASWKIYREQISAGLNFCLAGAPYWTLDIGAFFTDYFGGNYPDGIDDPAYRELYVRWFQLGAFLPIFRAHGTSTPREIWQFGKPGSDSYEALVKMNVLRYRLLSYIYSLAWKVTNEGYTIMRGLIMDFTNDKNVYDIDTQYMFGPSILVAPVIKEMYTRTKNLGDLVTSEYFSTPGGDSAGLSAEYYSDINFKNLLYTQTDMKVDFSWGIVFSRGINNINFGVRWTGQIKIDQSGIYEFAFRCDDHARLWIDDKLIIDKWNNIGSKITTGNIKLEGNKKYKIKIEFIQTKSEAFISLLWKKPESSSSNSIPEALNNKMNIYLPAENLWYDFWTGKSYTGGITIEREVPIDILPLYIKGGSILPMGPNIQYSNEKPADPIELRIYEGADAKFNIYEDENDNYNYEKGIYSIIPLKWNNKDRILTIGDRKGEFPGMLKERTFNIILVKENSGIGIEHSEPDKIIMYAGDKVELKL